MKLTLNKLTAENFENLKNEFLNYALSPQDI
jgi:hypothetical protein